MAINLLSEIPQVEAVSHTLELRHCGEHSVTFVDNTTGLEICVRRNKASIHNIPKVIFATLKIGSY